MDELYSVSSGSKDEDLLIRVEVLRTQVSSSDMQELKPSHPGSVSDFIHGYMGRSLC